ncbi:uncharacterized protein LOC106133692 [Amyelois transitella]|uniref:uncharacterized protein LOC106133692 n=1 Tax=Amyelois transitella TaxID=680683 RepID=UPI00067A8B88|nr:uncharacterized protein LOC106133692 [Amyelois transitella]
MIALKFLILAALITLAVAPLPHHHHHILDFGHFVRSVLKTTPKPWWPVWKTKAAALGVPHVFKAAELPLIPLAFLAKGCVKSVAHVAHAGSILLGLSKLAFPLHLTIAIHSIIGLSKALGIIVGVALPALGAIIGSIAIAAFKILLCVSGHGKLPVSGLSPVCHKDFGKEFGCSPYTGGHKTPLDIIDHYHLGDCANQINQLVHKTSHGKGLTGLHPSIQTIIKIVKDVTKLFSHDAKHIWAWKDIEHVVVALASILGVIGNSYSCTDGYGPDLVEGIIDYLTPIFKICGLDVACHENDIKDVIKNCGRYQFGGALKNCEDDKGGNGDEGDEDCDDENGGNGNTGEDCEDGSDENTGNTGNEDCDEENKGDNGKENTEDGDCD